MQSLTYLFDDPKYDEEKNVQGTLVPSVIVLIISHRLTIIRTWAELTKLIAYYIQAIKKETFKSFYSTIRSRYINYIQFVFTRTFFAK